MLKQNKQTNKPHVQKNRSQYGAGLRWIRRACNKPSQPFYGWSRKAVKDTTHDVVSRFHDHKTQLGSV